MTWEQNIAADSLEFRLLLTKEKRKQQLILHALIFFAISVNAFCLAYAFHDIFDGFSFQCILYAEPFIELQDIYLYPTTTEDFVNASTTLAPTSPTESNKVIFSSVVDDLNATSTTANGSETVSGKIINGEYWVFESNFKARVATDYRKTIFGHLHVCNVVLFHPLATFVLAIFATVMSIIYGKGGRGYDSTLCSKDIKYFTRRQDNFGTDIFYELQMAEETLKKSFKGLKRVDSFDEDEESGDSTKTTQV
ncbi:hypothetical protein NQ315_009091 [Exocentrus adspersus]|uniref:Uncharacterized protein n=1 Tax=Exocentrus adspersus TaxID=1586481 RepID=A0AAV8WFX5_9CUCU|nr:hypothetical protein NQ315_009091 [Exocentrus adspersus]